MTVPVSNPSVSYVAAGVGPYSVPFGFADGADVKVLLRSAAGAQSSPSFTLTNAQVTLALAPVDGVVIIYRDTPEAQTLALSDLATFPAKSVESALDRLTFMVQELVRDFTGAVRGLPGEVLTALPSAAARASRVLSFDVAGNPSLVSPPDPLIAAAPITSITTLRAATWSGGRPTQVYLISNWATGDGGGVFRLDLTDLTSPDNGGTIIVDVGGNRWKRQFSGQGVDSSWFSATVHLGVQAALDAGFDYILLPNFTAPISWTGQVTLPQARRVTVESGGQTIFVNPNIIGFSFRRSIAAVSGNLFTFKGNGGLVVENGLARTSIFIDFRGAAVTAGMTITRSGGIATVALPSPHLLSSGATVEIQGANQSQYNGRFVCTVTGANTLTFPVTGTPTTPATGNLCFSSQETANYNDNRVVVERAEFRGFFRDFYTERCGGEFSKISSRFNGVMWESGRDTSFIALSDILSVNDVSTIYYLDVYPNGLSNGVSLDRVYSVFAGGAGSVGGIYMVGIEGMTGQSNSVDLCFGATYGLTLILCTSLDLEFTWIASDLTQAPSHRGWYLEDAIRSTFRVATNVSSFVFGWVESSRFPTQPLYLSLNMPLFYGPANAGVIANNAVGLSIEPGYKFTNAMPRSAADYEFAGIGTCNRNTIGQGHMRGSSYTIAPGFGAASIVSAPLFIP
jgi:hypothetical protein